MEGWLNNKILIYNKWQFDIQTPCSIYSKNKLQMCSSLKVHWKYLDFYLAATHHNFSQDGELNFVMRNIKMPPFKKKTTTKKKQETPGLALISSDYIRAAWNNLEGWPARFPEEITRISHSDMQRGILHVEQTQHYFYLSKK